MFKNWKKIKKSSKNTVQNSHFPLKILVAPLDWGLGHTTRSIPIIRYLLQKGCQIWIAANSQQTEIMLPELPGATFLMLKGYNIQYPKKGNRFALSLFLQIPSILYAIFSETRWLQKKQAVYKWDMVISDNRYGFYHPEIFSVFITHQLHIRSGISKKTDHWLNRFNYSLINRFDECWVPDFEKTFALAGELSHPAELPDNTRYIGPLTRFTKGDPAPATIRLLVIISGPEPQRTIFEQIVVNQVQDIDGRVLIIRGVPGSAGVPSSSGELIFTNHLGTIEFESALKQAGMVLCRSGYSGIMDLVMMGKRAILVPTPGQTEQEYLAQYLHKNQLFFSVRQSELNLQNNLAEADQFPFKKLSPEADVYKKTIDQLLKQRKSE